MHLCSYSISTPEPLLRSAREGQPGLCSPHQSHSSLVRSEPQSSPDYDDLVVLITTIETRCPCQAKRMTSLELFLFSSIRE